MKCENCNEEHAGLYGSGRFCSIKCARSFSTKFKRNEINAKVSSILKGKKTKSSGAFKKGNDARRFIFDEDARNKALKKRIELRKIEQECLPFEEKADSERRKIILHEQNNKCNRCELFKWQGYIIVLELHHKDANSKNNTRENLEFLCPNCHSLTDKFRNRKKGLAQ